MHYRIHHRTICYYNDDIVNAQHILHLRPRALARQVVRDFRIEVSPRPASQQEHPDYFGNPAIYLSFQEPHRTLDILTSMDVEVAPPPPFDGAETPAWETVRDRLAAAADPEARDAVRTLFASPMVPPLPAFQAYARPSFAKGRPIGLAMRDLVARIHKDFAFDPEATTVATPIHDVFALKRGVCQDFAHLAVGCARATGLSARYVSGYLRTVPPPGMPRLVGADASHAWVSVWFGDQGWVDFDPTNDKPGSDDLVTIGWGRDYEDVSPMRGVVIGGGSQDLVVEIDVEPAEEESTEPA